MQKGDALSLRANARLLVDELNSGPAAALQRGVEIVNRKADVMNAGSPLRHEASDRRGRVARLQKLYQRLAGGEAHYAGPVGVIERNLGQAQHIPEKWKALGKDLYRDADMGDTSATRT